MVELFANWRPDQTSPVTSDLGLHCLPTTLLGVFRLQVNKLFYTSLTFYWMLSRTISLASGSLLSVPHRTLERGFSTKNYWYFFLFLYKNMLWIIYRRLLLRCFWWVPITCIFGKIIWIPRLSRALGSAFDQLVLVWVIQAQRASRLELFFRQCSLYIFTYSCMCMYCIFQ